MKERDGMWYKLSELAPVSGPGTPSGLSPSGSPDYTCRERSLSKQSLARLPAPAQEEENMEMNRRTIGLLVIALCCGVTSLLWASAPDSMSLNTAMKIG